MVNGTVQQQSLRIEHPETLNQHRHRSDEPAPMRRDLGEEPLVNIAPVSQRQVTLTFKASVLLTDLVERHDLDLRDLDQAPRSLRAVKQDREVANSGQGLAFVLVVPQRAGRRGLGAIEHQREELVGLRGCRTEGRRRRSVRLVVERPKVNKLGIRVGLLAGHPPESVDLLRGHPNDSKAVSLISA
jgi:hypothetical protein